MSQHRSAAETATNIQLKHWLNIFPLLTKSICFLAFVEIPEGTPGQQYTSRDTGTVKFVLCWRIIGLLFTQVYQGLFQYGRSFIILLTSLLLLTHSSQQLICFQWDTRRLTEYISLLLKKDRQRKSLNTVWALCMSYLYNSHLDFEPI